MFKNNRWLTVILMVVLVSVLVAACANNAPAPSTPAPQSSQGGSPAAEPQGTILLGCAGALTGDSAIYGTGLKMAVEFAVDEINANGGIDGKKVEVIYMDDKGDPKEAANVATKLASNADIFGVIGHVNSSCTLAALPIYQRAGLTCVSSSSSNPQITEMGYTNFLRTIINDYQQGPAMAECAVTTLGLKKVAIFYANSDYGRGVLDCAIPVITELGGEVVAQETYVPGVDKDFTPQLTKIKASGADALMILGDYTEAGLLARQMKNMGMDNIVKLGSAGVQSEQYIELAGTDAAEGTLIFAYWNPESSFPLAQEYVQKFQARYGQIPDERMAYGYDIPYLFKIAIEKGATKETLADVLHTVEYEGVTGRIAFEESGDVQVKPGAILTVKDGLLTEWKGN